MRIDFRKHVGGFDAVVGVIIIAIEIGRIIDVNAVVRDFGDIVIDGFDAQIAALRFGFCFGDADVERYLVGRAGARSDDRKIARNARAADFGGGNAAVRRLHARFGKRDRCVVFFDAPLNCLAHEPQACRCSRSRQRDDR